MQIVIHKNEIKNGMIFGDKVDIENFDEVDVIKLKEILDKYGIHILYKA